MYPKGEKFQYNNSGYVLLTMIIEKVTAMDFDKYLKKYIFDICNMQSTGYYQLDKLPSKCASSYIYCADTKDFLINIFSVDAKVTGAGGFMEGNGVDNEIIDTVCKTIEEVLFDYGGSKGRKTLTAKRYDEYGNGKEIS